jgi:hypothetical protein
MRGPRPVIVPDGFDHRRCRHAAGPTTPRPLNRGARTVIDAETVIARLEEAGHTLLSLPRSGPTTALRQTRHQYVAEALEAYTAADTSRPKPPVPPAVRITRMDQALAWIPLIPQDRLVLRRILGCRCLVSPLTGRHLFSWRRLARLLGADHKAIQRWHATGVDTIVAILNRDAAIVHAWDKLG